MCPIKAPAKVKLYFSEMNLFLEYFRLLQRPQRGKFNQKVIIKNSVPSTIVQARVVSYFQYRDGDYSYQIIESQKPSLWHWLNRLQTFFLSSLRLLYKISRQQVKMNTMKLLNNMEATGFVLYLAWRIKEFKLFRLGRNQRLPVLRPVGYSVFTNPRPPLH